MHTIPVNGALSISTIDRVAGVLPKERRDNASENTLVMHQLANNTPEQAMLGDFPKAVDDAILGSSDAHQNQMMQLLSDPRKAEQFSKLIFAMLSSGN